ncbi:hypothetical protein [Tibrogargan virus]|uniref:Uncharacterized protein U4 n=1 Tax=Tibrogargan virus (strain CS132) TaxID=1559361 RepID=U4_TIBVC|nr:hypothetical protein [Tibrogargan virus]D8V076.1 RecName: Full=Uncharacterized protein U4 [Tibrogargan virus strain CS132]ADG86353.1 hypothetical protein [Tibrogargan virus]
MITRKHIIKEIHLTTIMMICMRQLRMEELFTRHSMFSSIFNYSKTLDGLFSIHSP